MVIAPPTRSQIWYNMFQASRKQPPRPPSSISTRILDPDETDCPIAYMSQGEFIRWWGCWMAIFGEWCWSPKREWREDRSHRWQQLTSLVAPHPPGLEDLFGYWRAWALGRNFRFLLGPKKGIQPGRSKRYVETSTPTAQNVCVCAA